MVHNIVWSGFIGFAVWFGSGVGGEPGTVETTSLGIVPPCGVCQPYCSLTGVPPSGQVPLQRGNCSVVVTVTKEASGTCADLPLSCTPLTPCKAQASWPAAFPVNPNCRVAHVVQDPANPGGYIIVQELPASTPKHVGSIVCGGTGTVWFALFELPSGTPTVGRIDGACGDCDSSTQ